ncbi:MAG TPA: sulfite exporter TauE/SafE family protein [Clostridiales bacterium]|nr:sulfite exporter TauE/SafE family protein [Clostridiales bacterium]
MKWFLFFLTGIAGGVLGGMGMGGGTLLIPALTTFFGLSQKSAQAINLAAFIPMSAIASLIHFNKGRVERDGLGFIIVPAALASAATSFLANASGGDVLKKLFGAFLVLLAVFQAFGGKKDGTGKPRRLEKDVPLLGEK